MTVRSVSIDLDQTQKDKFKLTKERVITAKNLDQGVDEIVDDNEVENAERANNLS